MSEKINHGRRRFLGIAAMSYYCRRARHDRFCERTIQQEKIGKRAHD